MDKKRKLYKASEMAEILGVSNSTIWRYEKTGELESYRIGKQVRFFLPNSLDDDEVITSEKNIKGYNKLNWTGQRRVEEYIELLLKDGRFTK